MKKLLQTRYVPKTEDDNCFSTVIACIMDLESPEEVIQVQKLYSDKVDDVKWVLVLNQWLEDRGYTWLTLQDHIYNDQYYFVTGITERGSEHICIYKNGELYHDPHPSGMGLVTEEMIEMLVKNEDRLQ